MGMVRLAVKIGRKFGCEGKKLRKNRKGDVAEICPSCRAIRPQGVISYEEKGGILSSWTECLRINQCSVCCARLEHHPARYRAIAVNDDWSSVEELRELSNPAVTEDDIPEPSDPAGSREKDLCQAFANNLSTLLDDARRMRRSGRGGLWGLTVVCAVIVLAIVGFGVSPWAAGGTFAAIVGCYWLLWSFGTWRDVRKEIIPRIEHFMEKTNHDLQDVKEALGRVSGGWRIVHYIDWETAWPSPRPNLVWRWPAALLVVGVAFAFLIPWLIRL